jgi:hypothetical protein
MGIENLKVHILEGPGMMAHTCNSTSLGGEDRRIEVCGQPQQSWHETLSEKQIKELEAWLRWSSIPNTLI